MFFTPSKKLRMPTPDQAPRGGDAKMPVAARHFVLKTPLVGPFPDDTRRAMFGLGCFWGAERKFWELPGVYTTAVGYAAGYTPNPTYQEVCSGLTGHNEVVLVVYHPSQVSYDELLKVFWESHDPTQGMRQATTVGHSIGRASMRSTRSNGGRPTTRSNVTGRPSPLRGTIESRPRSWKLHRSITPRTTTSSTSRRTQPAIAGLEAPASAAPPASSRHQVNNAQFGR